jgi:hypothetical protein
MKYSTIIFIALFSGVILYACNQPAKRADSKAEAAKSEKDSTSTSCENPDETIMDPNQTKPMALMMRTMVRNAQVMRDQIQKGEVLDSLKYPFVRFYLVEPTDPSVLEPVFFENARFFQQSYLDLFRHPQEQQKYYNLMVGKCMNCHEMYCSGPLKRIKKLLIIE